MISLIIFLVICAFTDPLHDLHGIVKYQLINCSNQIINMIDEDSYKIFFIAFNISYDICVDSIPNYVHPSVYKMMSKNIKHLTGSICDLPEFKVNGFIDKDCFYGSIMTSDYVISIEIPAIIDNNLIHKVIVYRSRDIKIKLKKTDQNIHLKNTRLIKTPKLGNVNFENKYCGITVDMHKSFISLYQSLQATISSVINAIYYLNNAISVSKIEETPPIIFYLKEINKVTRLPYFNDEKVINMYHLHYDYNDLLSRRNRETCLSSLFIGINGNGTLGLSYIGYINGDAICNKTNSGSVMTKVDEITISDIEFWHTFTHEIGHALGCMHDPDEVCTEVSEQCPGGTNDSVCVGNDNRGRYIMAEYLSDFNNQSNRMFSECSVRYIKNLINIPARRYCFEAFPSTFDNVTVTQKCGNGILDPFEDCDSGKRYDKCCTNECLLTPGSECSDFNGKCCNNCKLLANGFICSDNNECVYKSLCDGLTPQCVTKFKNNFQCDNKHGICSNGECIKDICLYYNLRKCDILEVNRLCKISCTHDNINCNVLTSLDGFNFYKLKNTPCDNGKGLCSDNGTCLYTYENNFITNKYTTHISTDSSDINDDNNIKLAKKLSDVSLFLISTATGFGACLLFYLFFSGIVYFVYRYNKFSILKYKFNNICEKPIFLLLGEYIS